MNKIINLTKHLIDTSYNQFNLNNFRDILRKNYNVEMIETDSNNPIKLMSGNHSEAGIAKAGKGNIYLIGKGILFDSGGLNLKRSELNCMKNDKAGMLIALAVAKILPKYVTAYCPITTNFLQTSKITPGDVINIGNKKVEITDTDAEGRLILAEAISRLNVSEKDIIITIATLTGAVEYAIGKEATGVFGLNNRLTSAYALASRKAKELAWELPLWEHYDKKYKKEKVLKNWHKEVKCGATEAALFLKQFIKYPNNWLHLDIAFSAFNEKEKANGVPIRSIINFIRRIK